MTNGLEPDSDLWWLSRLWGAKAREVEQVRCMRDWLAGCPPLPHPDNGKPGFERLQKLARVNVAELLVEVRLHRMQLLGARTAADSSPNGDDVVSKFFVENDMRQKLAVVFRDMLTFGRGYLVLTADGVLAGSPENTICEVDAFGRTVASLTMYRDSAADRDVLLLMRPGYSVRALGPVGEPALPGRASAWFFPELWELEPPASTGLESVPVYEVRTPDGLSLIGKHLPTLERINHGVLQRLILIAMQSFKQRALKNPPVEDEETGEPIDYTGAFESSPDSLWLLPDGTDIWESSNTDFNPVLTAVKDDLRILAVQSKTPVYLISPDAANGSAEGAQAQRESLVFDVETLISGVEGTLRRFLSDAIRMAGLDTVAGSSGELVDRADVSRLRLIWGNPRRASMLEKAEAARAAHQAGIPLRSILEVFAELTPTEVEDALQGRAEDAFSQVLTDG